MSCTGCPATRGAYEHANMRACKHVQANRRAEADLDNACWSHMGSGCGAIVPRAACASQLKLCTIPYFEEAPAFLQDPRRPPVMQVLRKKQCPGWPSIAATMLMPRFDAVTIL